MLDKILAKEAAIMLKNNPAMKYKDIVAATLEAKECLEIYGGKRMLEDLWHVRGELLIARNKFNNCIDNEEIDLIISDINKLEKEEARLLKEVKADART